MKMARHILSLILLLLILKRTGISTPFHPDDLKRVPITLSLYPEYMEEADEADYVVIIDEGKIVAKGTPTELKDTYSKDSLRIKVKNQKKLLNYLKEKKIESVKRNDLYIIRLESTLNSIDILNDIKDNLESFQVFNGTLDDAFIEVTGKEIRE